MAENTPIGTAITSVSTVIISVFRMDGSIEQFSVVYFHANMDRRIFGTPMTTI